MTTRFAKEKLPEGYRLTQRIDLIRQRTHLQRVLKLSFAVLAAGILAGFCLQPELPALFSGGASMALIRILSLIMLIAVYMAGHEIVHGLFMWLFSRTKPAFAFHWQYAYAASHCFFIKRAYLVIALAPVVLWGLLFAVLAAFVPHEWFWVIWGLQLTNLSSSGGDLYAVLLLARKPDSLLIRDDGTAMSLYSA